MKDYAKKNYPPPPKKFPKLALLILLFLLAIIPTGLYFLKQFPLSHPTSALLHKSIPKTVPKLIPSAASSTSTPAKEEFDFYTLLPKMDVPVSKTETAPPDEIQEKFILQIAVLHSEQSAQQLKSDLEKIGINATVEFYPRQNGYRVISGPYSGRNKAEEIRFQESRFPFYSFVSLFPFSTY